LVTRGDDRVIEQIKKQLNKLIPVIKVEDISHLVHLEREMLLVKIGCDAKSNAKLLALAETARAKVIDDVPETHVILELTGKAGKLDEFLKKLEPFGIIETTRTGPVGMRRGAKGFIVD